MVMETGLRTWTIPQAEVDILGVDGVLYKGRMSSQFGTRIGEKDIAGKHCCFPGLLLWDLTLLVRTRGCRWTQGWSCPWLGTPYNHLGNGVPIVWTSPGTRNEGGAKGTSGPCGPTAGRGQPVST